MIKDSNYERLYTGSEINVNYLKGRLDEENIHSVVRNDHESSLRAGFGVGYTSQVVLFVEKENMVKAKRILEKAFQEEEIPEDVLTEQAEASRLTEQNKVIKNAKRPLIEKDPEKSKRSILNILLNLGLVIYSAWRLSPLLRGEELSPWRIGVSSFILVFCLGALIMHFVRK